MSASSIKWVVRRITLFLHFSFNKDHKRRREYGSMPLVGSSKMTTLNVTINTCFISNLIHLLFLHFPYHMATSANMQDESNPALWLATWVGKMELSCPLGTTHRIPQEKFPWKPWNKSFIDQACSVKMAGYCPHSFFCEFLDLDTVLLHKHAKKKNLANIQPSWPHTWSITHICRFLITCNLQTLRNLWS